MTKRFARVIGALTAAVAVVIGVFSGAAPAGAITREIHRPVLSVICDQPHHGTSFSAVRFRQHGRWAAGGSVIVELRSGQHTKVELHTTTGPHGWFALRRTLHSGPWIAGSSYTWTTIIQGKTWATARRGTVTLTGNC